MLLNEIDKLVLLKLANASIFHGLKVGKPLAVDLKTYSNELSEFGASFVTLERKSELRGCIGSVHAYRPLVQDIAENAFAAAFRDPRFQALKIAEFNDLDVHISILSPALPLIFSSEQELIAQLQPGIDGLILEERNHKATFLPSVWEQLPDSGLFLGHLKQKAGLANDYWSDTLKISRYRTEMIP